MLNRHWWNPEGGYDTDEADEELTRLTKQRDELIVALNRIAISDETECIYKIATEALTAAKGEG